MNWSGKIFPLLFIILFAAAACAGCVSTAGPAASSNISQDDIGYYLSLDQTNFEACGFAPGDLVDVTFSNGNVLKEIPYLSGSFTGTIRIDKLQTYFDELTLFDMNNSGLGSSSVTITLAKKQGAADLQKLNSYSYSDNRSDYPSDIVFANFRPIQCGNLKEHYLYRGASPVDNTFNRASTSDSLIREYGVKTDLNIADSVDDIHYFMSLDDFNSPYYAGLAANESIIPFDLGIDFESNQTKQRIAECFIEMLKHEGPFYIHCLEGINRAGFICILLETLGGASFDEVCDDYMKSYDNYYGIKKGSEAYSVTQKMKLNDLVNVLTKNGTYSLKEGVHQYLLEGGMSEVQIHKLTEKISK